MILKTVRRPSPARTIRYASRGGSALCVSGNMPMDSTIEDIIREFDHVRSLRPELKSKPVIHKIISCAEQDRALTPTECGAICQHVANELQLDRGPWMAWWHDDGHTSHLHLVALSIAYDGTRLETGNHFRRQMDIARHLELQYGLWRAPATKDGQTLPPLTVPLAVGGPKLVVKPSLGCGIKKQIKDAVFPLVKSPGMTLPELQNRLAGMGIRLVPVLTKDRARIQGLSFRAGESHLTASQVDKSFTLAGLMKAGVSYLPERDLHRLLAPNAMPTPKPPSSQKDPSNEPSPAKPARDLVLEELLQFHQRRNGGPRAWDGPFRSTSRDIWGRVQEIPGGSHCTGQHQREVLWASGHQGLLGGIQMALVGQDRLRPSGLSSGDWLASARRVGGTPGGFGSQPGANCSAAAPWGMAANHLRGPQTRESEASVPEQSLSDIPQRSGMVLASPPRGSNLAAPRSHHSKPGAHPHPRPKQGKALPRR